MVDADLPNNDLGSILGFPQISRLDGFLQGSEGLQMICSSGRDKTFIKNMIAARADLFGAEELPEEETVPLLEDRVQKDV